MRSKAEKPSQSASSDMACSSTNKLSVSDVVSAIAQLRDRKGSTSSDIRNALLNTASGAAPSFNQVKMALLRGIRDGALHKVDRNRFILDNVTPQPREAKRYKEEEEFPGHGRRRRRRSKGKGKAKGKGKGKGKRRRRRRGKGKGKGKKKGKGRRRRGRRGRGGKKKKGKGRRGRRRRRGKKGK